MCKVEGAQVASAGDLTVEPGPAEMVGFVVELGVVVFEVVVERMVGRLVEEVDIHIAVAVVVVAAQLLAQGCSLLPVLP